MTDESKRIKEMRQALSSKAKGPGGVQALIQMLGRVDRDTEKHILDALDKQNPSLAGELRKKYFSFEDIMHMEDSVLLRALSDVHRTTLALALKGTPFELQDKVFRNLSKRAAEMVKDEMDVMGPKHKSLVEEAQREVTKEIRRWKDVIL